MELISIIIPIYNVEKYLKDCVDSILEQTYSNLEIILVDDGSTDLSGSICDSYLEFDDRVVVYHKKNGGLSEARNYGIERSRGKYLYLVDADDFIYRKDTIEIMYKKMIEHSSDIVIAAYFEHYDDREFHFIDRKFGTEMIDPEEAIFRITSYKRYGSIFTVAHNKLYKRELFNDVKYPVGKLHEDEFTTYKLYLHSNNIVYIPIETYAYRQRSGSIMRSDYNLMRLNALEAFEERIGILKEKGMDTLETEYHFLLLLLFNKGFLNKSCYNKEFSIIKERFTREYSLIFKRVSIQRKIKLIILKYFGDIYYKHKISV
ncbi:glycosyltransferase family 2 protein [Streptococcus ruminantium]|uniref:glycosyltransferase family 2 protein n=1 Tax=Streptococcus ruminantium TaxID=1917441 RepID=UPI001F35D7FC|nr:glycosyltransferase family 2 protein [Streptococcus ruminantium]BDD43004.1 glycosyl transferase [Streptococcus ruminantium]